MRHGRWQTASIQSHIRIINLVKVVICSKLELSKPLSSVKCLKLNTLLSVSFGRIVFTVGCVFTPFVWEFLFWVLGKHSYTVRLVWGAFLFWMAGTHSYTVRHVLRAFCISSRGWGAPFFFEVYIDNLFLLNGRYTGYTPSYVLAGKHCRTLLCLVVFAKASPFKWNFA